VIVYHSNFPFHQNGFVSVRKRDSTHYELEY
jgi:hypothetical protein